MTLVLDGTNNTYLSATERGQLMTLSTAQATTSGTSIDFTGIPSWAKKITVILNNVSTSGTSPKLIQIGSGSISNTGYSCIGSNVSTIISHNNFTTGFGINSGVATEQLIGQYTLTNISSNTWILSGLCCTTLGGSVTFWTNGTLSLSGTLDRVRLTTINGTDTFDVGSVNILIEGSL